MTITQLQVKDECLRAENTFNVFYYDNRADASHKSRREEVQLENKFKSISLLAKLISWLH